MPSDNGFQAFWDKYPRHVGKLAAEKAFEKARKRATTEDLIAGVERAKAHWKDPQFIPHPSTWLNQGRWMDEYDATPVPAPQSVWRCPHVARCENRWQCRDMKTLGRPERHKESA